MIHFSSIASWLVCFAEGCGKELQSECTQNIVYIWFFLPHDFLTTWFDFSYHKLNSLIIEKTGWETGDGNILLWEIFVKCGDGDVLSQSAWVRWLSEHLERGSFVSHTSRRVTTQILVHPRVRRHHTYFCI